jgi:trehalose 6-phosphate phosphatase
MSWSTIWETCPLTDPRPTRPVEDIPSALASFDALMDRLNGRIPALFLDYDGTLTPIVDRPELAVLSDAGRAVVRQAAEVLPVAVVSGRDRADVERLVGIDSLIYAGSHGFDIVVPDGTTVNIGEMGDVAPLLDTVEAALHRGLDPIAGALIERKAFSIACHYRLVAGDAYPAFRKVLDDVLASHGGIKEKPGKKVFEIQPDIDWDKGKCVLALLDALGLADAGHVPLFLGDDVTDEDAFRALRDRGLGIVVSPREDDGSGRRSHAAFRVEDPDEILDLLRRLSAA